MKIETLFWIIKILFGLLIIIGWFLYLDKKSTTRKKIGKSIFSFSWRFIMILYIVIFLGVSNRGFILDDSQAFWEKYKLPQIDNMMPLLIFNNKHVYFESISKDSIRHDNKSIEYDIFDIYSINDRFENEKENKTLNIHFIKPNIIRDSSRTIELRYFDKSDQLVTDILSINQCDSVLNSWGLIKKAYKKIIE